MGDRIGFHVTGLKELDRALGKADKNLRTDLRDRLRDVADTVASEARNVARSKGLRDSGDLIAGIKPYVVSGGAGVRSSAVHRGFAYPNRLEFENRFGGVYGPRASLFPAIERSQKDIERDLEQVLEHLEDDFGGFK